LLPSAVKRLEKCNVLTVPYCVTCCDLLNERVDVVQAEVDAAELDITALKGRVTVAEGEIDALQAADTALAGRVTVAEGEIDALQASQIIQDGKILAAEGEIDALQASQIVQDGKILAAEGEIDALQAADTLLAGRVTLVEGKVIQSFVFNSATNKLRLTLQDTSFLEVDLAALAGGGFISDTNTTYGIELDADGHTLKLLGSDSTVDTLDLKPIIEAYSLPFTGGTLTGALNGTSATFSGVVSSLNSIKAFINFNSEFAIGATPTIRRSFNISTIERLANLHNKFRYKITYLNPLPYNDAVIITTANVGATTVFDDQISGVSTENLSTHAIIGIGDASFDDLQEASEYVGFVAI
jgi:hypothetical protein